MKDNYIQQSITLPQEGFVRLETILQLIPIGKSTWWAKVKSGEYPQPIKLGLRTTAWRVSDIRNMINNFTTNNEGI